MKASKTGRSYAGQTAEEFQPYHYRGQFVRAKDGDTPVVMIDQGFGNFCQIPVRLANYNAPELRGPDRESALAVKDTLTRLLEGRDLYIVTSKDSMSFERYVATIYLLGEDGRLEDVATLLAGRSRQ